MPHEYSSYELFGTDSEDEKDDIAEIKPSKQGNSSTFNNNLHSYFTIKYPKAYSRQILKSEIGKYYIELKIFENNAHDAESMSKRPRPRPNIVIKNRTNCDTVAWHHLKKFIEECRKHALFTIFSKLEED